MNSSAKNINLNRYSRNLLIEGFSKKEQLKIINTKVLVAGAGGLGSSVISNLSSIGFGTIGVIDYDVIEITNLNRQFIHKEKNTGMAKVDSAKEWIEQYNSQINVKTYNKKLDEFNHESILADYDLIIDCFDSYESKFMLNKACVKTNKTLIHGGVQEFEGQVMVIYPNKSACLNCVFPDFIKSLPPKGILSPIINIIGSMQVNEAINVVLLKDNILINSILSYDCIENKIRKIQLQKNTNCKICK